MTTMNVLGPAGRRAGNVRRRVLLLLPAPLILASCVSLEPAAPGVVAPPAATVATPAVLDIATYLDAISAMAPGDPLRQQAEMAGALDAATSSPSSANTLRYALVLGSAGHPDSNPVEARRLITELLAGANTLQPLERELASAFQREFDARVSLYAEIARQREEAEQTLRKVDDTAERRADALAAENARLRRQLAAAERKLEAVAEMERSLLEQAPPSADETPPQP